MSVVAASLIAKVSAEGVDTTKAKLDSVGKSASVTNSQFTALALGGVAIMGAALLGVGVKSVSMAKDFQSAVTGLVTGAGESAKNVKLISSGILGMAGPVGTTTKALTDGMFMIESAGFHGAAGLKVLQAAAMGAKVGNADLGVVADGVTTIMTDFASKNVSAANATNLLIATVASGKTHMSDLASSLSTVLPTAASAKVGLTDVMGAMATMTGEGVPAAEASTYLRQTLMSLASPAAAGAAALKDIGLSSQQVSDKMKISLPGTLAMITDALKKKFPEGSIEYMNALKNIAGGTDQMQGILDLTGSHMKTFAGNVTNISDTVKKGGNSIVGWSKVQKDLNFILDQGKGVVEALMIGIGTQLIPIVTKILTAVMPTITAFKDWVSSGHAVGDMIAFFNKNSSIITPILAGLGAMLITIVVPAVWSLAAGVIAATWPLLAIGVAVAGLVAIFQHFYTTNAPFKQFIDGLVVGVKALWATITANFMPAMQQAGGILQTKVLPILSDIGTFLTANFLPVWNDLVDTFKTQLLPLFAQLWSGIQPMLPLLASLALMIAGVLVGAIAGLVKGLAGLLSGAIIVIQGVVQLFTGMVQVLGGIIGFFTDLVTGHFDKLGADLGLIWQGIINMFLGSWTAIAGVFRAAWYMISGIVTGFIDGITGFFKTLFDRLIGHSIVPDLINGIVNFFGQLPGRVGAFVMGMVNGVTGKFGELYNNITAKVTQAKNWLFNTWNTVKNDAVNIFTTISGKIGEIWNNISKMIGDKAVELKNNILKPFGQARDGIGGILKSFANFMIDQLNNGIASVENFANLFGSGLNTIAEKLGAKAIVPTLHFGRLPHYAKGTANHPGGPAIVGEEGPEIIMMPRGTSVMSHAMTKEILSMSDVPFPAYAAGAGNPLGDLLSWIGGGATTLLSKALDALHIDAPKMPGVLAQLSAGIFEKIKSWALSWVSKIMPDITSNTNLPMAQLGEFLLPHINTFPGTMMSYGFPHRGFDFAFGQNSPLDEVIGGTVLYAQHKEWGGDIGVKLVNGLVERYLHLEQMFVSAGQQIKRGALIGLTGGGTVESGKGFWSEGAHLHYQIDRGDYNLDVNPLAVWKLFKLFKPFSFANGTSFAPGGMSWVGERGPELMYVPRGAEITPNSRIGSRSSSPAQPAIIILELNGQRFARAVLPDIVNTIRHAVGTHSI